MDAGPLFTIERGLPGKLSTMARPPGGAMLAAGMRELAAAGVTICVSMLTDAEMNELDLADEPAAARAAGIDFRRLPTPDFGTPARQAAQALAADLAAALRDGASVVVHCRGGVGRCTQLAAAVLIREGCTPEEAMTRISAARGMSVPETPVQRDFVTSLRPAELPDCGQAGSPGASHR
jgi:protein-tyrosine phosphatase